ncbi:MAG: NUDIX domain-containing protein [Bacteroidia bacterium]
MSAENPWLTLRKRCIYENPWIRLDEYHVLSPAREPGIYGVVHYKNLAIGLIPVDAEGCTYLVGQYRFPLGAYSWEIPEGGGKPDLDPWLSAERELREETGFTAQKKALLLRMHLSNSVSDELGLIYLVWDLVAGQSMPDATEKLTLWRLPLSQAIDQVHQGVITDSLSVAGLLKVHTLQLQGKWVLPFC